MCAAALVLGISGLASPNSSATAYLSIAAIFCFTGFYQVPACEGRTGLENSVLQLCQEWHAPIRSLPFSCSVPIGLLVSRSGLNAPVHSKL